MSRLFKVCSMEEVPAGTAYSYQVNNVVVAVFNIEGQYYAINDACPHAGASLSAGYLDGCVVSCPLHAWRFDVRDGTWVDNPCIATDAYPVTIQDGDLFIEFKEPQPE
mgnify:CR=1 FL=1